MVNIIINGEKVEAKEDESILSVAERTGFAIPHLCYEKGINEIGGCRLCCVEVNGAEKLVPACITKVEEGMEVRTNTTRVRKTVRANLSFIMSQHDGRCSECVRSGNCRLQKLCHEFHLSMDGVYKELPHGKQIAWPKDFPLQRDYTRCIKCLRCVSVCDKIQGLHIWDLVGTGSYSRVDVRGSEKITDINCALCGQCITHCPTAALKERDDIDEAVSLIDDPDIVTVCQIAPAIRAAWGEPLGLPREKATVNLLAGVLKKLGFDYVFDTSFAADLTIMEEASEFLKRKKNGDLAKYPMFTSCCPGWVRFVKSRYPELVKQLSTAKSPHMMEGSILKNYWAEKMGIDPSKVRVISIMPCIAKKNEISWPKMENKEGLRDVDLVLTTREVTRLVQAENIVLDHVKEIPFDSVLGDYSGAGVIFGVTGGVMEAALRSAYYFLTKKNPPIDAFKPIRDDAVSQYPWRSEELDINGAKVRVAVASGLGNVDLLCKAILKGSVKYDFVEMMACPNGCVGGGGQPIHADDIDRREERGRKLHELDEAMPLRFSHENPDIQKLYKDYLGSPLSEKAESLLHTDHFSWDLPHQE